ncbi:MAG: hypothetical protein JNM00_03325, partial [Flavobacteriales bacterium]|nr:hypothetical protein [Flavobacteriales bacterium]
LNENGLWSMAESRNFVVLPSEQQTQLTSIIAAEYFIDTEPGHGNGIPINITPGEEVQSVADIGIGALTPGVHYLFTRFMGDNGHWSAVDQRPFYVLPVPETQLDIISGEFFIDVEPGIGNGTPFSIATSGAQIEETIALNLPELSLGIHRIYIRLKNESGGWSMIEPRIFEICETYGPVSQYTYSENGNILLTENTTLYADSVLWLFGDGTTSALSEPIHTYNESGVYNLSLVSFNSCGIDTLTQQVTIEGLESVFPNVVSNFSVSTLQIHGFGFTDGTTVVLTRDGYEDLIPTSVAIMGPANMSAPFNFAGEDTGLWSVVVNIPGAGSFDLSDAVEVTSAIPLNTNITMTSVQPQAVRTGRKAPAHMHIENGNYADIIDVPVLFRDIADAQQSTTITPASLTASDFFAGSYQYMLDNGISNTAFDAGCFGSALNSVFSGYIIPRIPAQSSYNMPHYVKRVTEGTHQRGSGMLYPGLSPTSTSDNMVYENDICWSALIKHACESTWDLTINPSEWDPCFDQWNDSLHVAILQIAATSEQNQHPIPVDACISAILLHMAEEGCVSNLPAAPPATELKSIVAHVISNILYINDAADIAVECPALQGLTGSEVHLSGSGDDRENEFCDLVQECGGMCISGGSAVAWCLLFGNGVDPNIKTGTGNNIDDIYVDPGDLSPYTILFENDPGATAPVELISIKDTLQAEKFELESFSWGPVAIGDSIFFQPDPYIHHQIFLHDLRPFLPYYMLSDLNFDQENGVVSWDIATLDTVNLQPLDLMLDGILPPNIDGNEGAGEVSFFIRFHPGLTTGDEIDNDASIVFDFNQEVVTPVWHNAIDNTAPESEVNDLPVTTELTSFIVSWNGSDVPAGISSYNVYVSQNDGPFLPWIIASGETSAEFTGELNQVYKFYSVARDHAGNMELAPENPWENYDAITEIVTAIPELSGEQTMLVYPVPASDLVFCAYENSIPFTSLTVTDAMGNIVQHLNLNGTGTGRQAIRIDTHDLAVGLYLVTLHREGGAVSERMIIER